VVVEELRSGEPMKKYDREGIEDALLDQERLQRGRERELRGRLPQTSRILFCTGKLQNVRHKEELNSL
jgi:hypothetical protein